MPTLALDIGASHIKAAHSAGGAWCAPCCVAWCAQGLADSLRAAAARAPAFDRLLITTTAEASDAFATRRAGVAHVADAARKLAGGRPAAAWSTAGVFVPLDVAEEHWPRVASANWHALATFAARLFADGSSLLVDMGSTTTDLVRLRDGRPDAVGLTDAERLASGELLYTGARYTPAMAMSWSVTVRGAECALVAEHYANAGDVYLLLGELPADESDTDTCDGRPFTAEHSAARLARMVGGDASGVSVPDAREIAAGLAHAQRQRVAQHVLRVLRGERPRRVVLAGSGAFVAHAAARQALPGVEVVSLAQRLGERQSVAACATALLHLWEGQTA